MAGRARRARHGAITCDGHVGAERARPSGIPRPELGAKSPGTGVTGAAAWPEAGFTKGSSELPIPGEGYGKERGRAAGASCWGVSAGRINTQRNALTKCQTEQTCTNRIQKTVNSKKRKMVLQCIYSVFTSFGRGPAEMSFAVL